MSGRKGSGRAVRVSAGSAAVWMLLAAPAVLYLLYSGHFAVNVPYWDDWLAIPLLREWHDGALDLSMLYGGDNGQRAFFARAIGLVLAAASGFNTKVTIFAGDACLIAGYAFLLGALRRAGAAFASLVPVGFLFFSLSAYDVALWASNFSWSLATMCFVGALWFLQRARETEWYTAGALVLALVAAFSSFQGLLIWPSGLFYMLLTRSRAQRIVTWIAAATGAAVFYFLRLSVNYGDPFLKSQPVPAQYASHHIGKTIHVFVTLLGNVFSGTDVVNGVPVEILVVLGSLVFVLAIIVLIRAAAVREIREWYAVPATLIFFGLAAAAAVAFSRSWMGDHAALTPRYTLYTLLLLCGLYVAALRPGMRARWPAALLAGVLLPLQVAATTYLGVRSGAAWHDAYVQDAVATQHFASAPLSLIAQWVYWSPDELRTILAPQADAMHLSVFSYRIDLHPPCLNAAPHATGGPPVSENALRALRGAYVIANAPLGPASFSSRPFQRRLLDWAIQAAGTDGLAPCLLSYEDEYESAYAALSTQLAGRAERNRALLALPPAAAQYVNATPRARTAWQLLSFLYGARKNLTYEIPQQLPGFEQQYADWAVYAAVSDSWNPAWRVLAPYVPIYRRLDDILGRSAHAQIGNQQHILAPQLEKYWNVPPDVRFFHAAGTSFVGRWGGGDPVDEYVRSGRISVQPGATYEIGGTIDARFTYGPPPCFYIAEPSGYGIAMTCADNGARGRYTQTVRIPGGISWVYWVAYTNKTIIAPQRLLLYSDASVTKVSLAAAAALKFGPTPQSWWYLPPGFQFVHAVDRNALAIFGTGQPLSTAYAHSGDVNVRAGATYELSARIDARHVSAGKACVYLAAVPSGRGYGMLCARNGTQATYRENIRIPAGVQSIQTVAYVDGATVANNQRLSFSDLVFAAR